MNNRGQVLVLAFRYLWRILALILLLYVIIQNTRNPKVLTYQADWSRPLTANTVGWYPTARVSWQENALAVKAEPLYWQMYSPDDYQTLRVSGSFVTSTESLRLGLRQTDGSWQWQDFSLPDFSLDFSLASAQLKRNKLEMILSIPDLHAGSQVVLKNNWEFSLSR